MKAILSVILGLVVFYGSGFCHIAIQNAWVRPAREKQNTALYGTIKTDEDNLFLLQAKAEVANRTEIHTHLNEGGVMKMRPIDKLPCPQGETHLKRGGDHVMLIDLKEDLRAEENQVISIAFTFSNGETLLADVPVKRPPL